MNLQPVALRPGQRLLCACCGRWTGQVRYDLEPEEVVADIEGVPFKSYYCPKCAAHLRSLGEPAFLDFSDGRCRRLYNPSDFIAEAKQAAEATNCSVRVLNADLKRVGEVVCTAADGWAFFYDGIR